MNKKAFFLGLFADMLGWLIFFLGIAVWFIFTISPNALKYDISSHGAYLEDKTVLINILETPVTGNTNVGDEILLSIFNGETQVKGEIDQILNSIYGRANKVCWGLWYYEGDERKSLMGVDCIKKEILYEGETLLPASLDSDPIKIRLAVLGYLK